MNLQKRIYRYFYGLSCISFCIISIIIITRTFILKYRFSYLILFLGIIQSIISYLGDYYEYFDNINNNNNNNFYHYLDRIIAIVTFIVSCLFVYNTKSKYKHDYYILLFISFILWRIGQFCNKKKYKCWFIFHSFWHYIPVFAFCRLLLDLH